MERKDTGMPLTPAGRISVEHVATALRKVRSMDVPQKAALVEEISANQPNLLASCLVQSKLGADASTVEFLLNILLVCYQAMNESGFEWPLISEDEQERQLRRVVAAARFSEDFLDPAAAEAARGGYIAAHPEQPLLAFVIGECGEWLRQLSRISAEKESDKFVLMASVNLVNCIAYAAPPA